MSEEVVIQFVLDTRMVSTIPLLKKRKWMVHDAHGQLSTAHLCQWSKPMGRGITPKIENGWMNCLRLEPKDGYKMFAWCRCCGRDAPRWCRDFIRLVEGW